MDNKNICCVCGHKLNSHIKEDNGWRCHSLGPDFLQCECFLRDRDDSLDYYNLEKRAKEMVKEL